MALASAGFAGADEPAKQAEPAKPKQTNPAEPAKLEVGPAASEIGKKPAGPVAPASDSTPAAQAEAPSEPVPAGSVRLKYAFEVNQPTFYEVDQTVEIVSQKDRAKATDRNESHTLKHYRVIAVEDTGNALLELVIDKVRMSAKTDGSDEIAFDSDSQDEPPARFENVRQAIGKPLARITVTPQGEIKSTLWLNGQKNAAGETPDAEAGNNFLILLPERPVRPGDAWQDKSEVRVFVSPTLTRSITIMRNYELTGVKDGLATISVSASVLTPVRDPKIEGQLIQRTPSGTIVFDVAKGTIVSRDLKLDKTVIGVFDDNSSMRVVSDKTEKLVPREQATRTAGGDAKRN
jgi:hypothetical protein